MSHLQKTISSGHLARTTGAPRHLAKCDMGMCCDIVNSVSVTLASWAGCFAHMNGTYVLSKNGCTWSIEESDSGPSSPCDSGDADLCQTTTQGPLTYYWYNLAKARGIYVDLDNFGGSPEIQVRVDCRIWVYKLSGGSCTDDGANRGEINDYARTDCDSGPATFSSLAYRDTTGGLTNYTVGTVSLAIA